ncbi:MAG: hypothetical protein EP329_28595 [Deltaproteobacteria bacterium]|nr:MAG: hypothetical protein EP329_28595 [Deltaproteobacteria bacterium]
MSDIGPVWLRKELPQPIANAWHLALLGSPVDGFAAATAVEVALRFVSALQAASLLAEGGSLPELLSSGRFTRPSLGSWILLCRQLRDALEAPFLPDLGRWPEGETNDLLRRFGEARNALAHAGQMTPFARREAELELTALAAQVLETLGWLRRVGLLYVIEAHAESDGTFVGRTQTFRSWDIQPLSERAKWRGYVELNHLYLASTEPGSMSLLDVEPFLRRARLPGAHAEAICLWSGFGVRGDLRLSDDLQGLQSWTPIPDAVRVVRYEPLITRRKHTDATLHEVLVEEPPTELNRPVHVIPSGGGVSTAKPRRRGRGLRWPIWLSVGLVAVGGGAIAWSASSQTGTGASEAAAKEGGHGTTPTCLAPNLRGEWRFDATVLDGKPGWERGRAVAGHYSAVFRKAGADCRVSAEVVKLGYTYPDAQTGRMAENHTRLWATQDFDPSPTGHSIAAALELTNPERDRASIAFRVTREGDALVGLWRHAEGDWRAAGYSGYILGGLASAEQLPESTPCFEDCVVKCHRGSDVLDPATEGCLLRCVRRLRDCKD